MFHSKRYQPKVKRKRNAQVVGKGDEMSQDDLIEKIYVCFGIVGLLVASVIGIILALLVISLPFLFLSAIALGLFKIIQFLIGMP